MIKRNRDHCPKCEPLDNYDRVQVYRYENPKASMLKIKRDLGLSNKSVAYYNLKDYDRDNLANRYCHDCKLKGEQFARRHLPIDRFRFRGRTYGLFRGVEG